MLAGSSSQETRNSQVERDEQREHAFLVMDPATTGILVPVFNHHHHDLPPESMALARVRFFAERKKTLGKELIH
jgi:hypothetical protein